MKAFKLNITPYEYAVKDISENGGDKDSTRTMFVKFALPRIICNGSLGAKSGPGGTAVPPDDFDLMQVGPIAQKIEQSVLPYVILSKEELDILKKRISAVSKFFGFDAYEMFRRVVEAEETVLEEVK